MRRLLAICFFFCYILYKSKHKNYSPNYHRDLAKKERDKYRQYDTHNQNKRTKSDEKHNEIMETKLSKKETSEEIRE